MYQTGCCLPFAHATFIFTWYLPFTTETTKKPASQRDEVIGRNIGYSNSETTRANGPCTVQASLCSPEELKHPEGEPATAPQGASEHSLGTKSVNGSPLSLEKNLKVWYMYRLSREEYTRYIRTCRRKYYLSLERLTRELGDTEGKERNLLFIIETQLCKFKLCPYVILSKYFLILNAKRSIK